MSPLNHSVARRAAVRLWRIGAVRQTDGRAHLGSPITRLDTDCREVAPTCALARLSVKAGFCADRTGRRRHETRG